jgi:hypothetical protein
MGSASATHVGWTAGAGAEYAVTANISLKAEYLFVRLDGVSGSAMLCSASPTSRSWFVYDRNPRNAYRPRRIELEIWRFQRGSSDRRLLIICKAVAR